MVNEFGGSDGQILVFDDSKLHLAFNKSDEERLVLIIDMARPDELPTVSQSSVKLCQSQPMDMCSAYMLQGFRVSWQGCSQGSHSDALDAFILSHQ